MCEGVCSHSIRVENVTQILAQNSVFGLNSCGYHRQLKELFSVPRGARKKHFPFYIIYSTLDSLFIYILYIFMPFLTLKNFNFRRSKEQARQREVQAQTRSSGPKLKLKFAKDARTRPVSLRRLIDWWQPGQRQQQQPKSLSSQSQVNSQVSIVSPRKHDTTKTTRTTRTFLDFPQDVWKCK